MLLILPLAASQSPHIAFSQGIGRMPARLTASCAGATPAFTAMSHSMLINRDFQAYSEHAPTLQLELLDVPPTCVDVAPVDTPCASHRDWIPPLFFCVYTTNGAETVGSAVHAYTTLVAGGAVEAVQLNCSWPSWSSFSSVSAYEGAGFSQVQVGVRYLSADASNGIAFTFKGAPGGDLLRVVGLPTPPRPPKPPTPTPFLPPSAPPNLPKLNELQASCYQITNSKASDSWKQGDDYLSIGELIFYADVARTQVINVASATKTSRTLYVNSAYHIPQAFDEQTKTDLTVGANTVYLSDKDDPDVPLRAYLRVDFGTPTLVKSVVVYQTQSSFLVSAGWTTEDFTLQTCDDPNSPITISSVDSIERNMALTQNVGRIVYPPPDAA